MKIVNLGRFNINVGDRLLYNHEAVEWMNKDRAKRGKDLWPSADELNSKNPRVFKVSTKKDIIVDAGKVKNTTFIELLIKHNNGFVGLSGIIDRQYMADIWFLYPNGKFLEACPYRLFSKRKK